MNSLKVGFEPEKEKPYYDLATFAFLASGKDGYSVLTKCEREMELDDGPEMKNIVKEFFELGSSKSNKEEFSLLANIGELKNPKVFQRILRKKLKNAFKTVLRMTKAANMFLQKRISNDKGKEEDNKQKRVEIVRNLSEEMDKHTQLAFDRLSRVCLVRLKKYSLINRFVFDEKEGRDLVCVDPVLDGRIRRTEREKRQSFGSSQGSFRGPSTPAK